MTGITENTGKTDLIIRDHRLTEADRLYKKSFDLHLKAETQLALSEIIRDQAVRLKLQAEKAEAEAETGDHYMVFHFTCDLVIGHNFTGSEVIFSAIDEIEIIRHTEADSKKYDQLIVRFCLEKNPLFHIDTLYFTLSDISHIDDHTGGQYKLTEITI